VKYNELYFLGIGGIGMSALARYFHQRGAKVAGYDKTETALTRQLTEEGMNITYSDELASLPAFALNKNTLIVYTPAIPKSSILFAYFSQEKFQMLKRSQLLGEITEHSYTIAVGGTHGKTTTSSMVAHLLNQTLGTNAFLGGIATNFNSNLVVHPSSSNTVIEADEYDRSFLTLSPNLAVITSTDADHLDIYGEHDELKKSFNDFAAKIKQGGLLILRYGLAVNYSSVITYAIDEPKADFNAHSIAIINGRYQYDLSTPEGEFKDITIGLPGIHNVENSVAAFVVGWKMGIAPSQIKEALKTFKGVKRRFEKIIESKDVVFIDDYAHHPKELEMCITSVKQLYPTQKITGIFQPHLFSRTRDFAEGFAQSLSLLDELILLEIYPARELPIEGVNSSMLLEMVQLKDKCIVPMSEVVSTLAQRKVEVLLTLGAGDIDTLVEPIKNHYQS
jgi:UDP-N-acetylmuramate--alanine ligase